MICNILFIRLKPTGGFEASVCRQMWCWLEKGALYMWKVGWADSIGCGWQCRPSFHLLRCLSAKKGSRAWQSGKLSLAPPAEWGLGVDCVTLQMIHMSFQMCACVLWSWEASSVPETFLRSWNSVLSKASMSLRALSSVSGQVWIRCDSIWDRICVSAGSSGHPLHRGGYFSPTALVMCDSRVTDSNVTPADPHVFGTMERRYKFTVNKEGSF